MDIQVGDRVTFKIIDKNRIITEIVTNDNVGLSGICWLKKQLENEFIKILEIERPKYEVVEEKKELLTEKEKEILKEFIKYSNMEGTLIIRKVEDRIFIHNFNYLKTVDFKIFDLYFKKLEEYKEYTLKELGLEED